MDPFHSQDSKLTYDHDLRPTTLTRSSSRGLSLDDTTVFRSLSSHSELVPTDYKSSSTSSYPDQQKQKTDLEIVKSAYVAKEIHVEPPTVPAYLEPSYHLMCRAKPSLLLESIVSFAKSNDVEFHVLPEKYKVKCISYPLGESKVPFIVSIFKMDSDKQGERFVVEFQRRSGDILHFSSLWATFKHVFAEKGFIEKEKEKEKLKNPKLDDVTVTDQQIRETLQCLLQMASSKCYDVKCQAIAVLAKMSAEEQIQKLMLEESYIDTFLSAVSSKVEDIQRCAVFAIANMAQSASICQLIAQKGGVSILRSLSRSATNQVVRDCSRALSAIASRLGKSIDLLEQNYNSSPTQQTTLQLEGIHLS